MNHEQPPSSQHSAKDEEEKHCHENGGYDDILGSRSPTPEQPLPIAAAFENLSTQEPISSPIASPAPPSVFDFVQDHPREEVEEDYTTPTTVLENSRQEWDEQDDSFNLKPPQPGVIQNTNQEALAERLFSADHLDLILRDSRLAARFTRFLNQYRPHHTRSLKQYAELKKAVAAIDYANSIANHFSPSMNRNRPTMAAILDERFEASVKQTVEELVEETLPAYITHRLVSVVTDTLVKEITGNSAPLMQEMIPSLAEVYCITDPSLPDNPIVYASDEFYTTTQYGRDYVLGRNCRFLQGSRSSTSTVQRLIAALAKGEEICETILNYRRDGTPFMNLLMIAPMYDSKGMVRYFLGAQIDVSSLIENGRGLESFQQLLLRDRRFARGGARSPKEALRELTCLFGDDEAEIMKSANVSFSKTTPSVKSNETTRSRTGRIVLGMDDSTEQKSLWPHASLGYSGRLPGVYQNYLLVRPYPSLRITFTSAGLRIPGILQTKLLDRISGPESLLTGLEDAFERCVGVTAKVTWLAGGEGKQRWLHCTPLFGADDKVGVWMVVTVENEEVTGTINKNLNAGVRSPTTGAGELSASKLYADYLRREGRPRTSSTQREADEQFRDF